MSVRDVWIQNVKRNCDGKPRDYQLKEGSLPFLLNEGILPRKMDKCSVTLAKNMHVKLLKFHTQNMFLYYFHDD